MWGDGQEGWAHEVTDAQAAPRSAAVLHGGHCVVVKAGEARSQSWPAAASDWDTGHPLVTPLP